MSRPIHIIEHVARMAIGFALYWTVARFPVRWWAYDTGWFWPCLPLIGYYAHHPEDMEWWRPMQRKAAQ